MENIESAQPASLSVDDRITRMRILMRGLENQNKASLILGAISNPEVQAEAVEYAQSVQQTTFDELRELSATLPYDQITEEAQGHAQEVEHTELALQEAQASLKAKQRPLLETTAAIAAHFPELTDEAESLLPAKLASFDTSEVDRLTARHAEQKQLSDESTSRYEQVLTGSWPVPRLLLAVSQPETGPVAQIEGSQMDEQVIGNTADVQLMDAAAPQPEKEQKPIFAPRQTALYIEARESMTISLGKLQRRLNSVLKLYDMRALEADQFDAFVDNLDAITKGMEATLSKHGVIAHWQKENGRYSLRIVSGDIAAIDAQMPTQITLPKTRARDEAARLYPSPEQDVVDIDATEPAEAIQPQTPMDGTTVESLTLSVEEPIVKRPRYDTEMLTEAWEINDIRDLIVNYIVKNKGGVVRSSHVRNQARLLGLSEETTRARLKNMVDVGILHEAKIRGRHVVSLEPYEVASSARNAEDIVSPQDEAKLEDLERMQDEYMAVADAVFTALSDLVHVEMGLTFSQLWNRADLDKLMSYDSFKMYVRTMVKDGVVKNLVKNNENNILFINKDDRQAWKADKRRKMQELHEQLLERAFQEFETDPEA